MPLMPNVAYATHGLPSARAPVLLTHGFGASQAMWASNLNALSAEREVLTWDLPGHGASAIGPGELTHDNCIADMLGLIDVLGSERAVLGGMSLGGFLSLLFCRRHPERVAALVLVDTGPGFRDGAAREGWNAWVAGLADDLDARGLEALRRGPESASEHVGGAAGLAVAARGILAQRDGEVFESLGEISAPTLIVVGAEDERFLAAADAMARHIPNARKVVIADAGHAANIDQPAEFNRTVNDFLGGL